MICFVQAAPELVWSAMLTPNSSARENFILFSLLFFNLHLLGNCGGYLFMTLICTNVLKCDVKCHCLQWDTDSCLFELN